MRRVMSIRGSEQIWVKVFWKRLPAAVRTTKCKFSRREEEYLTPLASGDFAFNPGLPKSLLGFFLCIGFVKLLTSGHRA